MRLLWGFLFILGLSSSLQAANFSNNLSSLEVEKIVETIGHGSATKLMRSADALEFFPGFKVGLELAIVPARNINTLGDGTGTIPLINPSPRFHLSKGLFLDLDLTFSFMPSNIINTVATYGVGIKWTILKEQEQFASTALFLGYTSVSGFNNSYDGDNLELGLLIGKDYVKFRPYLGFGLLFAQGTINPAYVAAGARNSTWQSTIHLFIGAEIELPVSIGFQFDFMNLSPMGSLYIGKKF